jgi:hypothetical protein
MKNKMLYTHYRQGDVLLQRVDSLPEKLVTIAREQGRVILAHGEVTGHAHAITEVGTDLLQASNGEQFVRVCGRPIKSRLKVLRSWRGQVLVQHPKFGVMQFAIDDITVRDGTAEIDGEFALLKHDEHATQAVPAGTYRNIRQREYSPEEIRRVAD